jgi:glycosyltransferase involved in cell wall biosynthesis
MRVVLFANSIEMGGVEEHVRQLAVGLVERGAQVTVVCPETPSVDLLAERVAQAGAQVQRLTLSLSVGHWACAERLARLVRFLRDNRTQVVHVHLIGYLGGRWAFLAARLARVPVLVCTVHIAPAQAQPLTVRIERTLLNRLVDQFVAVSRASGDRLIRYAALPPAKTKVIPNAVELERFESVPQSARSRVRRECGLPEDAPVIGTVARLSPQKGLSYLIAALPQVLAGKPRTHVVLVGDGPLRDALAEQARALGVADRVHFVGRQDDVPGYLSSMDVFVLPSLFEGLPLSILEAMAAGLPVAATAVDGTPEVVEDGVTGRLVPPQDPPALASAILGILGDSGLARRMAIAARLQAKRYSRTVMLDRIVALYDQLLGVRS